MFKRIISSLLIIGTAISYAAAHASAEDPAEGKKICKKLLEAAEFEASARRASDEKLNGQVANIPREDASARFESYFPQNESQQTAHDVAVKFAQYGGSKSIGFLLSGSVGIGKTHLAVSVARVAVERGKKVLFLTPETMHDFVRKPKSPVSTEGVTNPNLLASILLEQSTGGKFEFKPTEEALEPYDVVIIDDLNADNYLQFISYGAMMKEIVMWAHRTSGKQVLITSNSSKAQIITAAFEHAKAERARFTDRFDTMFKSLDVGGPSNRKKADWAD